MMLTLLLACTPTDPPAPAARRPQVVATSVPVHHLAARLGEGQAWELTLLPPADADPGTWRPTPEAIARAQAADLLLLNGAGYEAWTATAALPATGLVRTADAVEPLHREVRRHAHGTQGAHDHGDVDPHTWTDPGAYGQQAVATHAALLRLPGADRARLDAALLTLQGELAAVEAELVAARPGPEWTLASNHPAFGHLGRRLGVDIHDLDLDPMAPPDAAVSAEVAAWAQAAHLPVILWEAAPAPGVTAALPAGLEHLLLDPLEHPPPGGTYDYVAQARANAAALRGLGRAPDTPPAP